MDELEFINEQKYYKITSEAGAIHLENLKFNLEN